MNTTSRSLLDRATQGDNDAWKRIHHTCALYVRTWVHRLGIPQQEADDLGQEALAKIVQAFPEFRHRGNKGSFRCWVKTIVCNCGRSFLRQGKCRANVPGGNDFHEILTQLEDSNSTLSRTWDEEHNQHVFASLLASLEGRFEPVTIQAFRRRVLHGVSGKEVAEELGISQSAVYCATSRVLKHLRVVAEGLLD